MFVSGQPGQCRSREIALIESREAAAAKTLPQQRTSALLKGNSPNHFSSVVRNQQTAITQLEECNRAAPDFLLIWPHHPTRRELANGPRLPVFEWHKRNRVAHSWLPLR